ncbi:molybdopterin-binding/glycosyltransferase family 2 protein [Ancylobacter sp. Lp-2]|uniref:NTP transferase domain-containing protein n=1 Tax=Ancylobacter sp. Lp-2 TaxID=2881339 RepID=UPI001E5292C1|nr:molybdopterin-binding/glycosyltransferase family 2 protein [Ancylobacter sp. Lp-2]MCB4768205.1 molybdopterin-binding/glycosyltransferase family 2 protein [Ancylobacter sp. Lp-2]
MKFDRVPLDEAEGAVNVHSLRLPGLDLRKGTRLDAGMLEALAGHGVADIVVAQAEPDDISEDAAAARVAEALVGAGALPDDAFTGRANIRAGHAGLVRVDRAGIDALNAVDEAVTLATLPAFRAVQPGEMIATVKIIPFAVPGAVMAAVDQALAARPPLVEVVPFRLARVAVISTLLPGLAEKVIAKTLRVTVTRLAATGAVLCHEERVPHTIEGVCHGLERAHAAGAELAIVFGASAIADRRDIIPAGLEAAGGIIEHLGMPVDPGNLLLTGRLGAMPVLGAPGCARSPKENGFDWVLNRLLAGVPVTRADIVSMGVGGLLMEIPSRPQPRESAAPHAGGPTAAIVLAAGRGTRMPEAYKLTASLDGEPLVRRVVLSALASQARPVIVVTGHDAAKVRAALDGLPVQLIHNPDYAEGLSSSIRVGLGAVPPEAPAAAVLLGDMPKVHAGLIDRLVAALADKPGAVAAAPSSEGRRGNPVVWTRRMFPALAALTGDVGARHLLAENAEAVVDVEVDDDAAFVDVDTLAQLQALELHHIAEAARVDSGPALDGMEAEDA